MSFAKTFSCFNRKVNAYASHATCVMCPHTRVNIARVSRPKKEQTAQWNFSEGFLFAFFPSCFSTSTWEHSFLLLPLPFLRLARRAWQVGRSVSASVLLAGRTFSFAVLFPQSYISLKSSTISHYDFEATRRQSYPLLYSPCVLFFLSQVVKFWQAT